MSDYIENIHMIPEHMQGAMLRWIEYAIPPGSFLTAVLSNDLFGTYGRADQINKQAIPDYIMYLYNHAPNACYGSFERVTSWKGLKEKI